MTEEKREDAAKILLRNSSGSEQSSGGAGGEVCLDAGECGVGCSGSGIKRGGNPLPVTFAPCPKSPTAQRRGNAGWKKNSFPLKQEEAVKLLSGGHCEGTLEGALRPFCMGSGSV